MTIEEFRLFHTLIYASSGIFLKDSQKIVLEGPVKKRIQACNARSVYGYYRLLTSSDGPSEMLALLDLVTINETYFFRNPRQFEFFENELIPEMLKRRRKTSQKRIRIWSAACSTGEEPYSIAISLIEQMGYPLDWDIRVYASDISLSVLQKAQEGVYSAARLREMKPDRLARYFTQQSDEEYCIRPEVKRLVVFDFHNLKNENGLRDLDAVFCRNVMIYFDQPAQRALIEKFYQALCPDGYLLTGHAETVQWLSNKFEFIHVDKATAYKKLMDFPK